MYSFCFFDAEVYILKQGVGIIEWKCRYLVSIWKRNGWIKKETIEYFLTLDKEIQKDIVEESEKNYFKMHPEVKDLEIFKKASYSLYLQIIYKELIYVIERNYPELLIESEKRYEILSWGG